LLGSCATTAPRARVETGEIGSGVSRRNYGAFRHGVAVAVKPARGGIMSLVPHLKRRAVLRMGAGAGAAAAGVWALSGLLDPLEPQAAPPQATAPFKPPTAGSTLPTKQTGSFISAARGGIKTNWVIAMPPGQTGMLRPVIALHGMDGNADQMLEMGVEEGLAKLVNEGKPPFAVVGVDGGNTYWHRRASGGDSGAMVLDELLPMLSSMGMDTSRVGFMGWSMGGYGALLLGARLGPSRVAGICAISPALYTSFTGSAPGAFDSYDDYVQNSVLGLPALNSIPLRVDCGTFDRFYFATRQFVGQLKKPPAGSFSLGGHDVGYWRGQLPAELAWMAS
jgi:enterochelin esterase-like enzyme